MLVCGGLPKLTKFVVFSNFILTLPDELKFAELPSMFAPSVRLCKLLDIAAKFEFICAG